MSFSSTSGVPPLAARLHRPEGGEGGGECLAKLAEHPQLARALQGLRSISHTQLAIEIVDVRLDRGVGQGKLAGDGNVGQTGRNEPQNLQLARSHACRGCSAFGSDSRQNTASVLHWGG